MKSEFNNAKALEVLSLTAELERLDAQLLEAGIPSMLFPTSIVDPLVSNASASDFEVPPPLTDTLTPKEAIEVLAQGPVTNKRLLSFGGLTAVAASLFARKVTESREIANAQRAAIVAQGVRSGLEPNRTIRNRQQIRQAIAKAKIQGHTPEDVIRMHGVELNEGQILALAADAYALRSRGRKLMQVGVAALLLLGVYKHGQSTVPGERVAGISVPNLVGDVQARPAAPSFGIPEATTTTILAPTTTTTLPRPKMTDFQKRLSKPLDVIFPPGTTNASAVQLISAATFEQWDEATFKIVNHGDLPADYPGGSFKANDCQGADLDLIRDGDTISGIATENHMTEQELSDLNEMNLMLAKTGFCIRVGDGNKGINKEGI